MSRFCKVMNKIVFHIVKRRNGAFIGYHSWTQTDKEVLSDRIIHFRALKPGETGYIKPYKDENNVLLIAITEV